MIDYDNASVFRIMCKMTGSVVPRCLPLGVATLVVSSGLALIRYADLTADFFGSESYIHDPFSIKIMSLVIGYLLVVRSNVGLDRWMTGLAEVQVMVAKWTNAFNNINGFLSGKEGTPEQLEHIEHFRIRVGHYFCLMSCLAFSKLRSGHVEMDLAEVPVKAMYPKGNAKEDTNFAGQGSMESKVSRKTWQSSVSRKTCQSETESRKLREVQDLRLSVLHVPSNEELKLLEKSNDKVKTMCLWIAQAVMVEVRNEIMDVAPPIGTRIFSELTDGMLGFQQASKIAHVPFPFPFAQMVELLLLMLYVSLPFYVDVFTRASAITPFICVGLNMCYCGLNQIALELEEPFGNDANDIDIAGLHESFVRWICDVIAHPMDAPVPEDHYLERAVLEGYVLRMQETGHEPWFMHRESGPPTPASEPESCNHCNVLEEGEPGVLQSLQDWLGISACCTSGSVKESVSGNEQVVEEIVEDSVVVPPNSGRDSVSSHTE